MKKYLIFLCINLLILVNSMAQEYFVKRIDFEKTHNEPRQIYYHQDRFFSIVGHFCDFLECSSLVEFTMAGDTLWRSRISDIDIARESMLISNDTITLTGNNDPVNTLFRMAHFTLEGEQLGETIEIRKTGQEYTDCYQLTTQRIDDNYFIMGSCVSQDTMYALLYVVDAMGRLDTLIEMASSEVNAIPWDSDIDNVGNLVTFHEIDKRGPDNKYRKIIKYDKNLDTLWNYETEASYQHLTSAKGTVLKDGKILLKTYTPGANHVTHTIRAIDQDKHEEIFYKPEKDGDHARSFGRIKTLKNGDVLGMGSFQDLSLDPPVHRAPWLIRFSASGEVLWQRVFYELDDRDNEARLGTISDVVELPNGDLYGVGMLRYEFSTSMVFKVSADGCLDPEDCGTIQFLSDVKNPIREEEVKVYPNPVIDILKVENNTPRSLDYMLIDSQGRTVVKPTSIDSYTEVNMQDHSAGIYYMLFIEDQEMVGQRKIIKE